MLLAPGLTHAQSSLPGTALIVRVPGDERIYIPLRAELGSYRFRVLELSDKPGRRSEALADLALARDAQAALRARPESMSVELWVKSTAADAGSDSEEVVNAGPGRNPDVLALRVTEAMRARGLQLAPPSAATGASTSTSTSARAGQASGEVARGSQPGASVTTPAGVSAVSGTSAPKPGAAGLESPGATSPAPAAPAPKPEVATPPATPPAPAQAAPKPNQPPPKPETAEPQPSAAAEDDEEEPEEPAADSSNLPELPPRRPLLVVEAAPLGILNTRKRSLGPAVDALVQLRLQPYRSSSISLVGFIPLWQPTLQREAGHTDVRAWFIGGFADLHVPLQSFELSAGLGAGAMFISVNGEPNEDAVISMPNRRITGQNTPQRLGAILGRIGMSLQLTRDLRLQARVMAGVLVPELEIEFGQDTVARWGRVLVLGSLGLELALPWER